MGWRPHTTLYQGTRAPGAAGDLGPGPLLFENKRRAVRVCIRPLSVFGLGTAQHGAVKKYRCVTDASWDRRCDAASSLCAFGRALWSCRYSSLAGRRCAPEFRRTIVSFALLSRGSQSHPQQATPSERHFVTLPEFSRQRYCVLHAAHAPLPHAQLCFYMLWRTYCVSQGPNSCASPSAFKGEWAMARESSCWPPTAADHDSSRGLIRSTLIFVSRLIRQCAGRGAAPASKRMRSHAARSSLATPPPWAHGWRWWSGCFRRPGPLLTLSIYCADRSDYVSGDFQADQAMPSELHSAWSASRACALA